MHPVAHASTRRCAQKTATSSWWTSRSVNRSDIISSGAPLQLRRLSTRLSQHWQQQRQQHHHQQQRQQQPQLQLQLQQQQPLAASVLLLRTASAEAGTCVYQHRRRRQSSSYQGTTSSTTARISFVLPPPQPSAPSPQAQQQPRGRITTAVPRSSAVASTSPSLTSSLSPVTCIAARPHRYRSLQLTPPSVRHSSSDSKVKMAESSKLSTTLKDALAKNQEWAAATTASSPTFFAESAKGQFPKILWLGCSDSRVPETTVLGLPPGAVFTHRNIANIFTANDLSSLSVVEYAVAHVGVQHVVVCGHTACGGVAAALGNRKIGVIDAWLQPLRHTRSKLVRDGKLTAATDPAQASLLMVEENVREGVRTLRSNPNVIKAAKDRGVTVHGLIYELGSGCLRELDVQEDEAELQARLDAHSTD